MFSRRTDAAIKRTHTTDIPARTFHRVDVQWSGSIVDRQHCYPWHGTQNRPYTSSVYLRRISGTHLFCRRTDAAITLSNNRQHLYLYACAIVTAEANVQQLIGAIFLAITVIFASEWDGVEARVKSTIYLGSMLLYCNGIKTKDGQLCHAVLPPDIVES